MTNIQIFNQVIYIFSIIGFIYYVINRTILKKHPAKTSKNHTNAKQIKHSKKKEEHQKKPQNYIEACWDEINKI